LLALLALSVTTPARAAWNPDPQNGGVLVDGSSAGGSSAHAVPDGAGGTIVVFTDLRTGTNDVYVQRLNAAGVPLWTVNGLLLAGGTGSQDHAQIISDGAGGAIFAWEDGRSVTNGRDIYVQRVNGSGTALWTAGGVNLSAFTGEQQSAVLRSDGQGGALVAWQDFRSSSAYYAQRVNSAGTPLWAANGMLVSFGSGTQQGFDIATDGSGGMWIAMAETHGAAVASVYTQHVLAGGSQAFVNGGVVLAADGLGQYSPQAVADGLGGFYVEWSEDIVATQTDFYVDHVASTGTPVWPAAVDIRNAAATLVDDGPFISDGDGGAFFAWSEVRTASATANDVYVQRLTPSGPAWTANGVLACNATNAQNIRNLTTDGTGGVIVTWTDLRFGALYAGFAQRLSSTGAAQWSSNGIEFFSAVANFGSSLTITDDGNDNAVTYFEDARNGLPRRLQAQRLDHYGVTGDPSPAIARVKDVALDQGGKVVVTWTPSYLDPEPFLGVSDYVVYRSVPGAIAQAWSASGQALEDGALSTGEALTARASARHVLDLSPMAANGFAWELVGTASATHDPATGAAYSFIVPTLGDSIAAGNPFTKVRVQARNNTIKTWYSAPDSGYSVDNIPPVTPALFTAQFAAGTARLHWQPNTDADLAGYRLYRGSSAAFTPSPATLVAALSDTGYADAAGAPAFYKLTAIDAHGNESPAALVQPTGTLGVGGGDARVFFLAAPQPNPARSGTTLRYGLASPARVRLALYDAAGRLVRMLADGPREAGEQAVRWDGRDDGGRAIAPGLYLARLSAGAQTITRRLVVFE
jgi:hypothetical protein